MPNILKVNNVRDYCLKVGARSPHPLVAVVNYSEVSPIHMSLNNYGVYAMFFQDKNDNEIFYGCGKYNFQDGSVICVAPGQIGGREDDGNKYNIGGWALLFHPDILHGTHLEKGIRKFSFFNYSVNEALHTTPDEWEHLECILMQIQDELEFPRDKEQDKILAGYIYLIITYCERFYNRQFLTRRPEYSDLLSRFQDVLLSWFDTGRQKREGLPSVKMCAEKLCMSANYFSDIVKRQTGESASRYIRNFVVQMAKNRIAGGKTIAEAAYDLGFEYPQHLTRMFKTHTGMTPSQYLASIR